MRNKCLAVFGMSLALACAQTPPALPSFPAFPALGSFAVPAFPTVPENVTLPGPRDVPNADALKREAQNEKKQGAPDSGAMTSIYSIPDARLEKLPKGKAPFIEVMDVASLRTWQKNRAECVQAQAKGQRANAAKCPQFEWTVPFSLQGDSEEVGRGLRAAWQRFEERYWWRAMTELNIMAYYPTQCLLGFSSGGLNTRALPAVTHVRGDDVPPQLRALLATPEPDDRFSLESYLTLFPQVPSSDFCDGLNFNFDLMYLPGGCTYVLGVKTVCLSGGSPVTGPGEAPLYFNMEEARRRVQSAIEHAGTTYYDEYQQDVLAEMTPGKHPFFFPQPWHSHAPGDGAVIAPITNANVSPKQFVDLAQRASQQLGGVVGKNAFPYYFQKPWRSPTLDVHLLPGRTDVLGTPPGVWKLEEFKRALGPSSLPLYEQMGYVNFFEAWNQLDTTILPEPSEAKLLRTLTFWATAVDTYIDFGGLRTVPVPTGVLVPPYNLPFANYRAHFGWVSVPEGYGIPRAKGTPLYDYGPLVR